MNNTII